MIEPIGIDHVALNVRDLERSLQFYTQVLGLKISPRENQKPGVEYFLDCGGSLVGLIQGKEGEGEHPFKNEGLGANHFSLRVPTARFDAFMEDLKKNGVEILFAKKRERSWSCYFLDPDGNKLEMTAWPLED
jgi:metallothiol transferase